MSIDNLNAEHRGQFNILLQLIRRQQGCSFCMRIGHNITTCNSDRLREFEAICSNQVLQTNTQDDFKNWLFQNYMSEQLLIKTFAIRNFRVTSRTSIEICINLVTEYIFRRYKNTLGENDLLHIQELLAERQEQENRRISEIQQFIAIENMLLREDDSRFKIISTVAQNDQWL